jgi:hypothetical protein
MKQIESLTEAIGKTVKDFLWDKFDEAVILTFEDGTFLHVNSYGGAGTVNFDDEVDGDGSFDKEDLFAMGIIDKAQYEEEERQAIARWEQAQKDAEAEERRLYEKLKAKFESSPVAAQ